jgi:hypothetical protein
MDATAPSSSGRERPRLPDQRCAKPSRLSFVTLTALEAQPLAELTVGPVGRAAFGLLQFRQYKTPLGPTSTHA